MLTFSIITPSFNQGEYLEETIKSVLTQSGDFAIDYQIIDGGSTDNSVAIIRKYDGLLKEGKWPLACRRVSYRWVSEKDNGQVDAIEKGFVLAKGAIGSWLNSDDVFYDSRTLAKVAREFEADPSLEVLAGDGTFIDKRGTEFGVHHVDEINFKELLYLDYHILQPATFVKNSVFKSERLDRSYNYCFDAEYFIRLISKSCKYKKSNDKFACFRLYPETKTLSGLETRYSESLRIAKIYDNSHLYFAISALYRYLEIVLCNKYPGSRLIRHITSCVKPCAYKSILGKWHR